MASILLSNGQSCLVDSDDLEDLSRFTWHAMKQVGTTYAVRQEQRNNKVKTIYLHRYVIKAPQDLQVDHKDKNGLNNTKKNLRIVTKSKNLQNTLPRSKSGYKGVYYLSKRRKCWKAEISKGGNRKGLGYFLTAEEAALAYNKAAIEIYGNDARLNEV